MKVTRLDEKLVEKALRAIRTGKSLPKEILALKFLQASNNAEQTELFFDFVKTYTLENLNHYRNFLGISLKQLQNRYRENDKTLQERFEPESLGLLEKLLRAGREQDESAILATAGETLVKLWICADFETAHLKLEEWSAFYFRYIESDALLPVKDLWMAARTEERTFQRRNEKAVQALTEYINKQESGFHKKSRVYEFISDLNLANYHKLYGSEPLIQKLYEWLGNKDARNFISVEGMGGLGKTSLVHAFVTDIAKNSSSRWEDILWLSARHQWYDENLTLQEGVMPTADDVINQLVDKLGFDHLKSLALAEKLEKLYSLLSAKRYLIVIDNLETLDDGKSLIEYLIPAAHENRFIFTSRHSLAHFSQFQTLALPELNFDFAQKLLIAELHRLNAQRQLSEAEIGLIYETIGGNPLALKLLATLLACLPAETVIRDLKQAQQYGQHEEMFRYIYRRTWLLLNDSARKLLLVMFDTDPNGTPIELIWDYALHCGMSQQNITEALKNLRKYSLLEISGYSEEVTYRLHRLTLTFLSTDIIHRYTSV